MSAKWRPFRLGFNMPRDNMQVYYVFIFFSFQWRHNGRDDVSNHHAASRLCTQPFVQTQIKENIKAPCQWPLWGEFMGISDEFLAQRDVIM